MGNVRVRPLHPLRIVPRILLGNRGRRSSKPRNFKKTYMRARSEYVWVKPHEGGEAMAVMQAYVDGMNSLRTVMGIWRPLGRLLVPLDNTLYKVNEAGEEEYDPPSAGSLSNHKLMTPSGIELGKIDIYDHPGSQIQGLRPYALCSVSDLIAAHVPDFDRSLGEADFGDGMEVNIMSDPPFEGTLQGPVGFEHYPAAEPRPIRAARINVLGSPPDAGKVGAAVTLKNDEEILVGIVVDFLRLGGPSCVAVCHPAYEFKA